MRTKGNSTPCAGWNTNIPVGKTLADSMNNPRPPAVPATLHISLEEYYAAAGAIGLLSAQLQEPEAEWAAQWSLEFGEKMAALARRRRLKPAKK